MQKNDTSVLVVGAGLAGCEAALFLAKKNIPVILAECKEVNRNQAQKTNLYAELVCTNSLKSLAPTTAHGLLKQEMQALGSLVLEAGKISAVPAGDALAVDREVFSGHITKTLREHPLITVKTLEVTDPLQLAREFGCAYVILATGPLTTQPLTDWIRQEISGHNLYFYDAIAPVVDADSLDFSKMYFKDRERFYAKPKDSIVATDEATPVGDYLNVPLNQDQYYAFIDELIKAEKVPPHDFEEYKYFEACLPIDTMAERGRDTARFSCMKPMGLSTPDGKRPFAVVQLRKENLLGGAFNLVGFQTRLTYKEQLRIFRMLPGFEKAEFIHLGSVHRNTFLHAREILNFDLSSKKYPHLWFAGQMTGVEGYTESAAVGLYVASQIYRQMWGHPSIQWPVETCLGSLINYLMTAERPGPSNVHFGLMPPLEFHAKLPGKKKYSKQEKKELLSQRASESLKSFLPKALNIS